MLGTNAEKTSELLSQEKGLTAQAKYLQPHSLVNLVLLLLFVTDLRFVLYSFPQLFLTFILPLKFNGKTRNKALKNSKCETISKIFMLLKD